MITGLEVIDDAITELGVDHVYSRTILELDSEVAATLQQMVSSARVSFRAEMWAGLLKIFNLLGQDTEMFTIESPVAHTLYRDLKPYSPTFCVNWFQDDVTSLKNVAVIRPDTTSLLGLHLERQLFIDVCLDTPGHKVPEVFKNMPQRLNHFMCAWGFILHRALLSIDGPSCKTIAPNYLLNAWWDCVMRMLRVNERQRKHHATKGLEANPSVWDSVTDVFLQHLKDKHCRLFDVAGSMHPVIGYGRWQTLIRFADNTSLGEELISNGGVILDTRNRFNIYGYRACQLHTRPFTFFLTDPVQTKAGRTRNQQREWCYPNCFKSPADSKTDLTDVYVPLPDDE